MNNLSLKQKIMIGVGIIGAILILIFQRGIYPKTSEPAPQVESAKTTTSSSTSDSIEIVSTSPSPLEQAVVWAMQPISITFNTPLENVPEFKHKIDPSIEYKAELSDDKKTITLTPTKPFNLGYTYNLRISRDTKFEGGKTLGKDMLFTFRTIEYKGV